MTIEEIKEKYGNMYGYIFCEDCPLSESDECPENSGVFCDGFEIAYNAILSHSVGEIDESDNVNHPAHYTRGGIECLDAIAAAVGELTGMEAVYTAQIIKYVWRWKWKNGAEDLGKARFYLDKLIALEEKA